MRKLSLGLSFVAMASLVACGDGSGTNANSNLLGNSSNSSLESDGEYDSIVAEVDNLPKCTEEKDGKVYYVKEDGVAYTCRYDGEEESGEWVRKKKNVDDDQESSSSVKKADVSSSSEESDDEYDGEVEEFGELPKCTAKKDGKVYYVEDEDITYTCRYDEDEETGEWVSKKKKPSDDDQKSSSSTNGDDDSSSSEESVESSSSAGSIYDPDENTLTDLRDGRVYRTTTIAPEGTGYSEVWMAENLNYAYTGVPFDNGYYTSDSTSWCYDNDPANCAKYGRLYTWAAAMDSVGAWSTNGKGCGDGKTCSVASAGSATLVRGVCPKGWHLPSHDEWEALFTAVDASSTGGAKSKLKSQTGWTAYSGITNEDAFGFSGLPAGYRNYDRDYSSEGDCAFFWSSTETSSYDAYLMYLGYYDDLISSSKNNGFSVRCLKD